jgi:hypothetical protein
MSLHYIIATYCGTKTEYALEIQLQQLLTIILAGKLTALKQITVMCPQPKLEDTIKPNYYNKENGIVFFRHIVKMYTLFLPPI